jgi:hypothetical protein
VFVKEALDDLIREVSQVNAVAPRPVCEVRHAVQVLAHRVGRVMSIDQSTHIGRDKRREIALAQPRCRHRMNGLECIHGNLLKWGWPHRRRLFLCEVQTSLALQQVLVCLGVREVNDDKFA